MDKFHSYRLLEKGRDMKAQATFDKYRKSKGLKTFSLNKGQVALIEDTGCPFLVMLPEERRETWSRVDVKPIPTFLHKKEETEEARRIRRLLEIDAQRKKEETFEKLKAKVPPKGPKLKQKLGEHVRIKVLKPNARKPGTNIAVYYAEMIAYVKAHPKASAAEVMEKTRYRAMDYKCDMKRKNITAEPI